MILDADGSGLIRERWPENIARPVAEEAAEPFIPMGTTVESIADRTVVERHLGQFPDATRRVGIFLNAPGQQPVRVNIYGFIKRANLHATGNWNGYE